MRRFPIWWPLVAIYVVWETGFLIKKGSDNELHEKLLLLINDEKKSQTMGKEGKKFVSKYFSWEKIATDLVQIASKHLWLVFNFELM